MLWLKYKIRGWHFNQVRIKSTLVSFETNEYLEFSRSKKLKEVESKQFLGLRIQQVNHFNNIS